MDFLAFQFPQTPGLVSIVTPARNGERFIGAALESIAAQTYDRWEVIVIEDGSQDGTEEIVRAFAAAHPHHRVHFQRNPASQGVSYTRNRCFELAAGQYVALLDCDDRWLPTHLQACIEAMESSSDDVAYSVTAMFDDHTDQILGICGPTHDEVERFPHSLLARCFITPSATVIRRQVIEEVGALNSEFRYCEDLEFFLRAVYLGKRFRCVSGIHCFYRKNHAEAATKNIAETIEVFASLTSWHLDMPGGSHKQARRMVAANFAVAARLHAGNDPAADPSARRSRVAPLYFQAWKLRPNRIAYLLNAVGYALTKGWSANPNLPSQPTAHALPISVLAPARAAA